MPVTRDLTDGNIVIDWTKDIVNKPVLNGMVNAMTLFNEIGTSQTAIAFERDERSYTVLPQSSRTARTQSVGKDRSTKIYTLPVPYWNHKDALTPQDVQDHRKWGTADEAETVAAALNRKQDDMIIRAEQSKELMKIEALKGVSVDTEGNTLADMFTEFGVSQDSVDYVLGTGTTNITAKNHELLRLVGVNNRNGLPASMPVVLCGNSFFTKYVTHEAVEAAYANYPRQDGVEPLRGNLFNFTQWGAYGTFLHQGILFVNYEPSFTRPDGSSYSPIGTDDGYVIFPNAPDLYRGYNGPANSLSGANQPGAPMFMYQYSDPRGKFIDLEMEMSPLYFMTNPLMSIKVTTSN